MQKQKRKTHEITTKRLVDLVVFFTGRNRKTITSLVSRNRYDLANMWDMIAVLVKLSNNAKK